MGWIGVIIILIGLCFTVTNLKAALILSVLGNLFVSIHAINEHQYDRLLVTAVVIVLQGRNLLLHHDKNQVVRHPTAPS